MGELEDIKVQTAMLPTSGDMGTKNPCKELLDRAIAIAEEHRRATGMMAAAAFVVADERDQAQADVLRVRDNLLRRTEYLTNEECIQSVLADTEHYEQFRQPT